jgi:hypothetical protein
VYRAFPARLVGNVPCVNLSRNNQTYLSPNLNIYGDKDKRSFRKLNCYKFINNQSIKNRRHNKVKASYYCYSIYQLQSNHKYTKQNHSNCSQCCPWDWGTFDYFDLNWHKEHSLQIWQESLGTPCIMVLSCILVTRQGHKLSFLWVYFQTGLHARISMSSFVFLYCICFPTQ